VKDYYQILRISRHSTSAEIKRAYRRLAVVFHPDKNRSPEASALFQEINEAHQILSDPLLRARYDGSLRQPFVVETPPESTSQPYHRDPAYRRRHAPGYRRPPPQPSERLLMMIHFLKYLRLIAFAGIGWCAFLVFDYALPFRVSEEKVISESNRIISWQFHHVPYVLVTEKSHQFPITAASVDFFPVGSTVKVLSSRILNILVRVEAEGDRYTLDSLETIYQNLMFAPLILLVISSIGLTLKKGIEFRFSFAIVILTIMFFNLIFLLFSIL
jgi:hypothetical protein